MEKNRFIDHYLDLRGFDCPLNFVKCCLALENLDSNQILNVDLDTGEAETTVMNGLQDKGYKVDILKRDLKMISLKISSEQKQL